MRILNITARVSSQLFYGACPCVFWRETFPYVAAEDAEILPPSPQPRIPPFAKIRP